MKGRDFDTIFDEFESPVAQDPIAPETPKKYKKIKPPLVIRIRKILKFLLAAILCLVAIVILNPLWELIPFETISRLWWRIYIAAIIYAIVFHGLYKSKTPSMSEQLYDLGQKISHLEYELWDYLEPTKDESIIKELEREINILESRIENLESEHDIDYYEELLNEDEEAQQCDTSS